MYQFGMHPTHDKSTQQFSKNKLIFDWARVPPRLSGQFWHPRRWFKSHWSHGFPGWGMEKTPRWGVSLPQDRRRCTGRGLAEEREAVQAEFLMTKLFIIGNQDYICQHRMSTSCSWWHKFDDNFFGKSVANFWNLLFHLQQPSPTSMKPSLLFLVFWVL